MASLILVLGGARSGKSAEAERIVTALPPPWLYVATAQALDDEMRARIAEHRARRTRDWQTVEAPIEVPAAIEAAGAMPVLVDCITLWLTNLMLGGSDLDAATAALEGAVERDAPTVLVANEVGLGIVPENTLARRFRDEAGRLNQRIAERADRVLFMVAGLAMRVK